MENVIFEVIKERSNVKGFWKHEGKLYIDNIKPYKAINRLDFQVKIDLLFVQGEKAVFAIGRDKAFVIYPEKMEVLTQKIEYHETSLKASKIKALLNQFNGLTIERESKGFYIITIWKE